MQYPLNLILFPFLIIFLSLPVSAQDQRHLDSLELQIPDMPEDTDKVFFLKDLSFQWRFINAEKAITRGTQALELSHKLNFTAGKAISLNVLGLAYNASGNYLLAIDHHKQAYSVFSDINDSLGMSKALHNMGYAYSITGNTDSTLKYYQLSLNVAKSINASALINTNYNKISQLYLNLGNYVKAMEFSQEALRICEKNDDLHGQSEMLNTIGLILKTQNKFDDALSYLFKSYELSEKISDKSFAATVLNNIGIVYDKKKLPDEALKHYLQSLKIKEETGNLASAVSTYSNIALLYKEKNDLLKAGEYNLKALAIDEAESNVYGICIDYINLAEIELMKNERAKAKDYLDKASLLARESGYLELLANIYGGYTQLYDESGNHKEALHYHKLFMQLKDSILNEGATRQMAEMQTKYETEKKDSEIKLLSKDKALQEEQLKQQKIYIYSALLVILLVVTLVIFIYRSNKHKQLANKILERKNLEILRSKNEIEEKNSELESAHSEVIRRKKEIEEKNEEVIASIRYAKRIQQAVLKAEKKVTSHLPDHFVLFKPKDIVSGDFYWAAEKKIHRNGFESTLWYVAVADCTGHGVPGAFLTMLGMSFLNEIMATGKFITPAEILGELRYRIIKELGQTGKENESKDGMDISLVSLNLQSMELQWAGANNPLYLLGKNDKTSHDLIQRGFQGHMDNHINLFEIKADKQPVGYFPEPKPFTNHTFQLSKDDSLFLFSDGYADQFGGPKGKKFKYSQFEKLLISIQDKSMDDQKEILDREIEKWRGDLEQIDDICIIGLKV